ncbi:helix-turn-helix domain-containing protein [Galbitalea sp. SE-J8]|uniref:helix-turn-helix domain-containing protein n=1 Tax=Galbitalea sp. SE-J8 TaxID=3054952 RepID=UPI00259CA354|nr:helix-turn-helix domain-containing protein [Galbitalea sp. SE-J8]MDM4762379.1 helix-turn-helix domain-containing protein [Galbitalea sp. SE-J8]
MTDIFTIVADATRRGILEELRERAAAGEAAVDVPTLVEALGSTRQSVNRQLATLAEAGLVVPAGEGAGEGGSAGAGRRWSLDASPLEAVEDWLVPFLALGPVDAGATVFSAWSGADVGETIGRTVAERSFRVRSALQGAQERVADLAERLPEPIKKRVARGK